MQLRVVFSDRQGLHIFLRFVGFDIIVVEPIEVLESTLVLDLGGLADKRAEAIFAHLSSL